MSRGGGEQKTPVAVLGATGLVGQHLVRLLDAHPWFELTEVVASHERAGERYGDSVDWALGDELPGSAASLRIASLDRPLTSPVVFSALPGETARSVEARLAGEGHLVCSNASAHRMDPDVPLLIPEVNAEALSLFTRPRWGEGRGRVVTNPNCVVAGLVPVLAPIDREWGIESGVVVTLQALSGAGLGGPTALRSAGNVIPFIPGEEEKISEEVGKILGRDVPLAVAANRVPVPDGHMAHVFLRLRSRATPGAVDDLLSNFVAPACAQGLPSVPDRPVRTMSDQFRPQPALDIGWAGGMGVTVGRIREASGFDVALTLVVHNAVRGAAGACLANAELAWSLGWGSRSAHPSIHVGLAGATCPAAAPAPP